MNGKHTAVIVGGIFSVCCLSLVIILIYHLKLANTRVDLLQKENTQLEVDLAERDNVIYDLQLEVATTNKTLALTAHELELLEAKGEILHLDYCGEFNCTAYCCEKRAHICGSGSGKTASGAPVTPDVSVAVADLEMFPYGTVIYIEGVGVRIVQDTGGFDTTKIDCAVDTHKHALNWEGQGKHKVYIVEVKE